jgi:hypothetical protein
VPRSLELVGTYIGRSESPETELLVQEAIGEALGIVLSERGLYQKAELSLDRIAKHLESIKSPNFLAIKAEFSRRPWVPVSPGVARENQARAEFFCGVTDSPLSASSEDLKLTVPLPTVKLYCPNCKDDHTFSSITAMWWDGFAGCYPKFGERTEQVFNLTYDCVHCKSNPIAFLIKREGLRLSLCGRSERLQVKVPRAIPKLLQPIVRDAIGAANENDLSAGFYHLRTFCEHYMKLGLQIPFAERITGEALGDQYNASLDARMTSGMPSMLSLYEKASKFMHERIGTMEDFSALLDAIEGHLSAKELFLKYRSA